MKLDLLDRFLAAGREGVAAALATDLLTGAQRLITGDGAVGELVLDEADAARVRLALDEDRSQLIVTPDRKLFVEVWSPRLRLILVGGVHTAQALVPLARLVSYEVTVVDPRTAFGSPVRFPETRLVNEWPDRAVPELRPDRRTAIVTLTHNPRIDDPALQAGMRSDAFYIGALGSRRTHAERCKRLAGEGFDEAAIRRIRGPVGLAIGALTPAEIALSIMAEITASLRAAPLAEKPPSPQKAG
ncbi:MAG: xanthine dehydrogenase [Gammaproteobacteria bacterium]|nr:xanthine dehydrogenase [Gammaproteobacteria bacterium]